MTLRHVVYVFLSVVITVTIKTEAMAATAGKPGGRDLVIVKAGKTDATVVVSPDAGATEKLAAADLVKYIGLMTGARPGLADTADAVATALKKNTPLLIVGKEAVKAKSGLSSRLKKVLKKNPVLRAEAIVLLREKNRVYLAGHGHESSYFAVAELLRRWGCRWFIPTDFGECIPEHGELAVGDLDHAYAPPFEMRTYWISWVGDYTGRKEFKLRNMMNDGVHVPSGHALGKYVKGLGKSVYNIPLSDKATAEHVANQIADKFAKGEYITLGMDDGMYQSDSAMDKKLMTLQWDKYFMRASVTDAFMEFYNNVARALLRKHPKSTGKIGFLAYSNMTIPPVRDITAEKPLFAYLAPIDIDPIHGMDDPQSPPRREYRDMLYRWAKVMEGRLAIYDYDQGMLVWRDIPNPSHQSFKQDVKHYRDAGIVGIDTESRNAIGTTFINLYMRGQLMWNPDEDTDALLADFYPKFFGPASKPMSRYWNRIFEVWEKTICTEHEYFVAPAIYTPEIVKALGKDLAEAEKIVKPLRAKNNASRNEKLYVDRMNFMRMSFDILDSYMKMVGAAATEIDYKAAAAAGEKGLATRERLTDTSGIFTTYRKMGEGGYAWWPGEVKQYRELLPFTDGTKGTLVAKLPLEWAFRRDQKNVGLKKGYHKGAVDLAYWKENKDNLTPDARKDYPDKWEMLRTDLYAQAQGIRHPDRQSFVGHIWYRTDVDLTAAQAKSAIHIKFPGLFCECWLYVNGKEAAYRKQGKLWWLNDYRFEWDADLTGKFKAGKNTITLRGNCEHHFGGMFRRPFLYTAKGQ